MCIQCECVSSSVYQEGEKGRGAGCRRDSLQGLREKRYLDDLRDSLGGDGRGYVPSSTHTATGTDADPITDAETHTLESLIYAQGSGQVQFF